MRKNNVFGKIVILGLINLFIFVGACSYPPDIRVDTKISVFDHPYDFGVRYERDHEECLERARGNFPVTEAEIRQNPHKKYILNFQRAYVIDCLTNKGYGVLTQKEARQIRGEIK